MECASGLAVDLRLVNVLSYIQYASFKLIPIRAGVGFATAALEAIAKAVAAGMLVSGFMMAAAGLILGRSRRDIEARALRDATTGGLLACGLLIFDLWMRYIV
jgi:hypothetical protein